MAKHGMNTRNFVLHGLDECALVLLEIREHSPLAIVRGTSSICQSLRPCQEVSSSAVTVLTALGQGLETARTSGLQGPCRKWNLKGLSAHGILAMQDAADGCYSGVIPIAKVSRQ